MRDSDPITRLTAARFDGPQALYTTARQEIEALAAENARLAASEPTCALVKPLVWEHSETTYTADRETGRQEPSALFWQADTILAMGRYTIMRLVDARIKGDRESYRLGARGKEPRFRTLEAAKAAAQADYEARILSALSLRHEAEVRAEAWAAALEAAALKMAKGGLYTVWDRSEAIRTLTPPADISAAMDRIKAEEYARGLADGMLRGGADAAKAIADAKAGWMQQFSDVRTWFHYPIVMPLKDGSGPASDAECDTITWEVWDKLLNSHASFDNLPDAINEAMRLNNAIPEVRK